MPAVRTTQNGRNSALSISGDHEQSSLMDISFVENITPPVASVDVPATETAPKRRRQRPARHRKGDDHVPRPPNAFILYRSWCIKGECVPESVEANHSTISQIIGRMWKALSKAQRDVWHERARLALEEHKARYPKYSFRPTYPKRPRVEKRKMREIKPKDDARCAKIVQLLAEGKTGAELNRAVEEFDRHHVPEVVTRFDAPLTETAYRRSSSQSLEDQGTVKPVQARRKSRVPSSQSGPSNVNLVAKQEVLPDHPLYDPYPEPLSSVPNDPAFDITGISFEPTVADLSEYAGPLETYNSLETAIFPHSVAMPEPRRMLSVSTTFLRDWSSCPSPVSSIDSPSPATPYYTRSPLLHTETVPVQPSVASGLSTVDPQSYSVQDLCKTQSYEPTCGFSSQLDGFTMSSGFYSHGNSFNATPVHPIPNYQHGFQSQEYGLDYPMYLATTM